MTINSNEVQQVQDNSQINSVSNNQLNPVGKKRPIALIISLLSLGIIGLGALFAIKSSSSAFVNKNNEASSKFINKVNPLITDINNFYEDTAVTRDDAETYSQNAASLSEAALEFKNSIKQPNGLASTLSSSNNKDKAKKMQEIADQIYNLADVDKLFARFVIKDLTTAESLNEIESLDEGVVIFEQLRNDVQSITNPEIKNTISAYTKTIDEFIVTFASKDKERLASVEERVAPLIQNQKDAQEAELSALNQKYNELISQLKELSK